MVANGRTGEDVLGRILDRSHRLHPDDLVRMVAEEAAAAGLHELVACVVDHDQRLLIPLPGPHNHLVPEPLGIDTTIAGRAYRQLVPFETDDPTGRRRVWVPMLDGAERAGVIGVRPDPVDDEALILMGRVAALLAELIVSKWTFGDSLEITRRRRDMDLAAELRWALLPPLSFESPRVAVSGVLQPAYQIAGDAFDYAINGDTVHLAIIDAMGHGLEASRIANLAVCAYRNARRRLADIYETFRFMDQMVAEQFGDERFVTGQLGTLDLASGRLRWISAGHPRPLLLRNHTVIGEIPVEACLPIGLGDVAGEAVETALEPGDVVVFYTDGVTEARNEADELFGVDRLGDMLERAASAGEPLSETVRRLSHAVLTHQSTQLRDDATLLAVKWQGPDGGPPADT